MLGLKLFLTNVGNVIKKIFVTSDGNNFITSDGDTFMTKG